MDLDSIDISTFEAAYRQPSLVEADVAPEGKFCKEKVLTSWAVLSQRCLREIQAGNARVCSALEPFVTTEISPKLIKEFLDSITETIKSPESETRQKVENVIVEYANIDVPEEFGSYSNPRAVLEYGYNQGLNKSHEERVANALDLLAGHDFANAVSKAERQAKILWRTLSRDIKFLALAAELETPNDIKHGEYRGDVELTTKNGIEIIYEEENPETRYLLNPSNWKRKKEIHNRVHEVLMKDGRKFIIKEQKTKHHKWNNREAESASSGREYSYARTLHERYQKDEGRIKLSWEKPLGYVRFPDGYQFVIFAFEEEMYTQANEGIPPEFLIHASTEIEKKVSTELHEEFKETKELANKYVKDFDVTEEELTPEGFSKAYAFRLTKEAHYLFQATKAEAGFEEPESEVSDCGYRLNTKPSISVETIGFDLEYVSKKSNARPERTRDEFENYESSGHGWFMIHRKFPFPPECKAWYCALLEKGGIIPDVEKVKTM